MLSAREQKELRALHRRKLRQSQGRFLAEGVRLVEDLLASPVKPRWALASSSLEDSARGQGLLLRLSALGVPVRRVSDTEFEAHAATESPQGVLLVADTPRWELADLTAAETPPRVVLVLDGIQDPGNLGTLIRSAEALGATGVVVLPGSVDPWNPKAVRAAMGSSFRLPVIAASWPETAGVLRGAGFALFAAEAGGEAIPPGTERAALVVGNEGAGVSENVRADVDLTVGIPLRGRAESLNVAAAAAILLHELMR